MKTLLMILAVIAVCFNLNNLFCQHYLSGVLTKDTTLSLSYSPYIVSGNVMVNAGVTLTIEPGVILKFDSSKAILINGTLIAKGNNTTSITFTSNQTNPNRGDWGSIKFSPTSVPASYDVNGNYISGSIIDFCTIEYGGATGNNGSIILDDAYPFIVFSTIRYSNSSGIAGSNLKSAPLKIMNCTINDNQGSPENPWGGGISIHSSFSKISILNNRIFNNKTTQGAAGLIIFDDYHGDNYISNNDVYNNSSKNGYGGGIGMDGGVNITKNIIRNNYGYHGGGIANGTTGGVIKNNIIINNSAFQGGAFWGEIDTISNNIIVGNSAVQNTIYHALKSYISMNQFLENNSPCIIYDFYGTVSGPVSNFVHNTTFLNNNNSVKSSLINNYYTSPIVNYNNFIEDSLVYLLYNQNSINTTTVDATNNYWSTTITSIIDNKIFDFNDDFNQGAVNYKPFLTALDTNAPISPPRNVIKQDLGGGFVMIRWDANSEADLKGYKLYWTPNFCCSFVNVADLGNAKFFLASAINFNDSIALTAYDNSANGVDDQFEGHESWFSYAQIYHKTGIINQPVIDNNYNINVYPNPFKSNLTVTLNRELTNGGIRIYNIYGELIHRTDKFLGNKINIAENNLPCGMYFMLVTENGEIIGTKKLIIE